jgi:hypothetical protein
MLSIGDCKGRVEVLGILGDPFVWEFQWPRFCLGRPGAQFIREAILCSGVRDANVVWEVQWPSSRLGTPGAQFMSGISKGLVHASTYSIPRTTPRTGFVVGGYVF